jgi:antirestriction protein ArdC
MKSERFDIHQYITDRIITAIERGVNILTLWTIADE